MPQAALAAAVFAAQAVGSAVSAGIVAVAGASAATLAAGAALVSIAYTSYAQKKATADARKDAARAPRDITVRSAIEPARIIYGTARTSGPVVYTNTAPTPGTNDNSTLWTVISLCQHEIDDITEIWLDGDKITSSQIDWAGTGGVTSGKYGPIGSNQVTNFYRRLGTDTQTHVTELATAFSDWTSDYDGRGVAYIVSAFELGTATGEGVWAQGAPSNIRAVVKGKKVYDPRKDSTQTGGSGTHRLADPTTWEWSDNPALCLADYLFDARLGMGAEGVTYDDIDWSLVISAANVCDTLVTTPAGNQKRFTCNGALSTGETYAENIKQLLSSMSGQITWSGGKYRIRAAAYEAPTYTFTGDDVIGDVQIQPERTRTERYNKIRGTFIDPDSDYVATEFIPVENTSYKNTRDGGQTLSQEIRLPFTNDEYMAQRIAFKQLNLNNQQLRCIVPFNWKAMKVAVGDRIQLTVDELSWSNKIFRVDGWSFDPDSGFNLTLQEDSSSAYADPGLSDYSTRTLAGVVSFADQAVSAPSGLQATSEEEAILLEWDAPPRASGYDEVVIYASATSAWSGASEVGRTRGTSFRHELARGTQRYYWVRAVDVDGRESTRDPDSDTSSIQATAGQIATSQLDDDANFAETAIWSSVSGDGRPEDDATVGATVGTNLFDTDGTTVLGTTDVVNSVLAQEILNVELENETILDLETGLEVDIQNLGDVAIFVNESNSTIQGNIDTLEGNIQSLTGLIGDVTAGVADVYLQDTAPVAGVGGIPDPIPDGSRWYDTDDNNAPYYWNGTAWTSLLDPRIGQNAAAVTALQTRMTTAEGDIDTNTADISTNASAISANSSAISTLDSTVVSQGNSITALSADVVDLTTALEDEGGNFSTTSNAVTVLQSRVTQTETDISSNSTSITTLTNNLSTTNGLVSGNTSAINALDTRLDSAESSLTAQASSITQLQSDLDSAESDIGTNATALSALTTRVTSAEGNITVNTSDIVTLTSDLQAAESDIADNAAELVTQATQASVLTARIDFITKVEGEADQDPIDLESTGELDLETLDDVTSATSSAITSLDVRTTAAEGSISTQASQITQLQSVVNDASTGVLATATAVDSLDTRVTVNEGEISTVASDLTSLTTTVGNNSATISTQSTSIDGLEAQYTVKIDNNGRVAGFGLASTAADATPFSEFVVIADQFSVVDPASTASTPIIPFQISGGKALFTSDVEINGDLITTGTITATRLNLNGTMFTAPSGVLTIADGGVGSDQLASGSVDIAKFASGLQPIQVVGSLPGSASEGDQAYLTTDNKLYRYDGSAWIKAVDGADVSSGTLPASAIVANSITAGQIQAGAIGATEISVTNLAAISADLGTVTAGSLASNLISGDISTFVTFADTSSQLVTEDDGETVIQTFLLPGNSLGLQPIIIATAYFNYNTGMDQDGLLVFRVRQGQNSTTGTVVSTLIIHNRRESGVIESGSINIIGVDSEKTADQYYSITVDVDSGNLTDGATFSNVRGVVIGGR